MKDSYSLSSYSSLTSCCANTDASEVSVYAFSANGKCKVVSFNIPIFHCNDPRKVAAVHTQRDFSDTNGDTLLVKEQYVVGR